MLTSPFMAAKLRQLAEAFLAALQAHDFDQVWPALITTESRKYLASTLFLSEAYQRGAVDTLFDPPQAIQAGDVQIISHSRSDLHSMAFNMDVEGIRTDFFTGLADNFQENGWTRFVGHDFVAIEEEPLAVVFGETSGHDLFIVLLKEASGAYKVDLQALVVFSMTFPPSALFKIANRGLE